MRLIISREADQVLDQLQRHLGMAQEEGPEVGARQDRELRRLEGHHRGRARLIVEHHFAEVLPGSLDGEDQLLAVLVGEVDLHPAAEDQVQRIALVVALVDDDRLLRIVARHRAIGERAQIRVGNPLEQREALEVGRHGLEPGGF